ncbi:MAG: type I-B CRISPR-associated protein Cas7/Csh2 [Planctomycetes bacterium]|nr:type I-B CRISPR-associated protein Cas7/Csh2 [Planctomycetota bacterium]
MSVEHRSEILFIYEVVDANPNGDPLDENKPRTDPDTGVATVSDVRIKRTIRDYWKDRKNLEILIRDTHTGDGYLKTGKQRAEAFEENAKIQEKDSIAVREEKLTKVILKECIDARVFGCTLPIRGQRSASPAKSGDEDSEKKTKEKAGSVTLTGPVQFSGFNRSFHRVAPWVVQGTAAFASEEKKTMKSFREDKLLPYAAIGVYGIVNEMASRTTEMTDADRAAVLEGLWLGTKDLISRSKFGHAPLLLLHVVYKNGFRVGDLARRVRLMPVERDGRAISETAIRSVQDYTLDFSVLRKDLKDAESRIERVEWQADVRVREHLSEVEPAKDTMTARREPALLAWLATTFPGARGKALDFTAPAPAAESK